MALMSGPPPSESEHAYASIHGGIGGGSQVNYDDLRPINIHQPLMRNALPFNGSSSSSNGIQRIEMV